MAGQGLDHVSFFFFFLNFLAVPGNMWKLSSLTRD